MKNNWRLEEIKIKFEKGYSFKDKEEEKHDRYVGKIEFKNNHEESFNLNIPSEMTSRYMELMKDEIINTASALGDKIADSIRMVGKNEDDEKPT